MNVHIGVASKKQVIFFPTKSKVYQVTPQFIDRRIPVDPEDGGGTIVRLGLSKADQSRLQAMRVEISRDADDPPIELHQKLDLIETGRRLDDWGFMKPTIIEARAEVVPFTSRNYVKVDGIPATTCRALEKRFGANFAKIIAGSRDLSATRFSPEKYTAIIKACEREVEAALDDTARDAKIVRALCSVGATKAAARKLAGTYIETKSPYQFLFKGRLSFLQADRFAHIIDAGRTREDRPMAIAVAKFLESEGTVVARQEIRNAAWMNYQLRYTVVDRALERLVEQGIVRNIGEDFGLARLIEAEEKIAAILSKNHVIALTNEVEALINFVLDNAAKFLNRKGFVPNDRQRKAVRQAFANRFSIITGGPGTGKTAIAALINAVGSMLWPDDDCPVLGIALAGRAASNLREAAMAWWQDRFVPMQAMTVHRALGMEAADDEDY